MSRKYANPTLAEHIELARMIHTAEDALSELLRCSRFFYSNETNRLIKSHERGLGSLKSRLEDTMLHDYPHLNNDWLHLYYGDASDVDELERRATAQGKAHASRQHRDGSSE